MREKGKTDVWASWFETAQGRLLTMMVEKTILTMTVEQASSP
jgi:hypothetical protein